MQWNTRYTALLAATGLSLLAPCFVRSEQPPQTEPRLLVLTNGEVMRGQITWAGDRYYVSSPGRQIAVPAEQVDFTSTDIESAFHRKRAAVNQASIVEYNQLAEWCIRHRLLGQAASVLADGLSVAPRHQKTSQLIDRLRRARRQEAQHEASQRQAKTRQQEKEPRDQTAGRPNDLQAMANKLPAGSIEQFTNRIQPLLVNGCAASKCHGGSDQTSFRLVRMSARTQASRMTTEKNLQAVLQYVDRKSPVESKLLKKARQPHGGGTIPPFRRRGVDQYRRLADWVGRLDSNHVSAKEQRDAEAHTSGRPNRFDRFRGELSDTTAKSQEATARPATIGAARSHSSVDASDPFDPAPFNRRFFPNRSADHLLRYR